MDAKRALIVDDEPDIRELLEITLGRMNVDTEAAADLKMQSTQKAHTYDLDEAAQIERTLRSELAVIQGSSSELSQELVKLQSRIVEKDNALQAATREADEKLQTCIREFEMSRDERETNFMREMAEMTESHHGASQANLDITARNMQKQIDEADARTKQVESHLQQTKIQFDEKRLEWQARETALSTDLSRASAQQTDMGKQLAESEMLVTEMSAELERIQSEQNSTAGASASDIVEA